MAQIRKLDCQVEIKCSADKFYDAFRNKIQLMPKIADQVIADVKLVQGSWEAVGSVRLWTYIMGGNTHTLKEIKEAMDDKCKTMTFTILESELMNDYKTLKSILNVKPMGEGSLVTWTLEYEKQNKSIPDPVYIKDFWTAWIKNVDANLVKA